MQPLRNGKRYVVKVTDKISFDCFDEDIRIIIMITNAKVKYYGGVEFDDEVYQTVYVICLIDGEPVEIAFGSMALWLSIDEAINCGDEDVLLAENINDGFFGYIKTDVLASMDNVKIEKFIEKYFDLP